MSETEYSQLGSSPATALLQLVVRQLKRVEGDLTDAETLHVIVCTPDGRMEARELECLDPDLLIVHGIREGLETTLISTVGVTQVAIVRNPLPPEQEQRYFGFRID